MKQKLTSLLGVFVVCNQLQAQPIDNSPGGAASGFNSNQYWSRAGNNNGSGANNIFGTRWGSDIWIMTNSRYTARFTYNDALTSLTGDAGDGLRIINPLVATGGNLDLFTSANSGTNETHARFGNSGQISGQNNRMEFLSNGNQGFWFDALTTPGNYKFAQQGTVYGFLGTNHFWRIGEQGAGTNLNAERRLHVVDRDYQFRLTYAGSSSNSIFYTDFYSNDQGNLQILPSGKRVGINTGFDPQATIDVNGDARIRNVQIADPFCLLIGINADPGVPQDVNVRRLDFTANPNDVLLGNGTFGPVPGIGAACGSPNSER